MRSRTIFNQFKKHSWYYALFLLAVSLPFSKALISISITLAFIFSLFNDKWATKMERLKSDRALQLILSIFFLYITGICITDHLDLALHECRKNVFIPLIALTIGLSPKPTQKQQMNLFVGFVAAINIAIILGIIRTLFRTHLSISDTSQIAFVGHIPITYQLALAFFITGYYLVLNINKLRIISKTLLVSNLILIIEYMLLIKSFLGMFAFAVTLCFGTIRLIRKTSSSKVKIIGALFLGSITIIPSGYVLWAIDKFYSLPDTATELLDKTTARGNYYSHSIENSLIENGNYVGAYVCEKELREEWNKKSALKYDDCDEHGYQLSSTLIRYLTAKGVRKDANGVAKLTSEDIDNIEHGISNPIFLKKFTSLYPRIYKSIWEMDAYYKTGNPNQMSLAQRVEFAKGTLMVISDHLWLGVGTGNWKAALKDAYQEYCPNLDESNYAAPHNQYLSYAMKFGIIGFVWILFAIVAPIWIKGKQHVLLLQLLMVMMMVANLGDSNFETHIGQSFFFLFYSLFLWWDCWQLGIKKAS